MRCKVLFRWMPAWLALATSTFVSISAQEFIAPPLAPINSAPIIASPNSSTLNSGSPSVPSLPSTSSASTSVVKEASAEGLQTRRAAKPVVEGHTFVDLDKSLQSLYTTGQVRTLDELKALELQQTKVAALVQSVAVNVRQGAAQGSGVLISNNYVLTAAHVGGRPKQRATVVLNDGTELPAEVLGMNRNVDAGLLKIVDTRGKVLPYATIGHSRTLRKGQLVLGAGHPGGWQSGRGFVLRAGRIIEVMKDTLITDVALIGGDSGGPLFNIKGELIGIHSRIGTDVSDNMHVPIDIFDEDWAQLKKGEAWGVLPGYRPMIGVGLKEGETQAVLGTVEGPAYEAGLKVGDIVTKFDGRAISTFKELQDAVLTTLPGDYVKIEVLRGTETLRLKIRVAVQPQ